MNSKRTLQNITVRKICSNSVKKLNLTLQIFDSFFNSKTSGLMQSKNMEHNLSGKSRNRSIKKLQMNRRNSLSRCCDETIKDGIMLNRVPEYEDESSKFNSKQLKNKLEL